MALFNYRVEYSRQSYTGEMTLAASSEPYQWLSTQSPTYLSPAEQRMLDGMTSDRRRESYLRGRWAAKSALISAFGGNAVQWAILPGVFGQPIAQFLERSHPPVTLSISHSDSGALALVAPAAWPAAVDCEAISERNLDAIESQLTRDERQSALNQSEVAYIAALTMMWSLKESASKILGGGLAIDLGALELTDCVFSDNAELKAKFLKMAHLQGVARTRNTCVSSVVFPESSKINNLIAPLLVRETEILSGDLIP